MKKFILIATTIILLGILLFIFTKKDQSNDKLNGDKKKKKNGVQYITINAQGGYSPRISKAQANIPTKLIVKTNNTYDCSAALVIKSVNYQKLLPQTGEEMIDLGIPTSGATQGLCSMGMYSFTINFE